MKIYLYYAISIEKINWTLKLCQLYICIFLNKHDIIQLLHAAVIRFIFQFKKED